MASSSLRMPCARRCGSSGCSIAFSINTRPCSSTPDSRSWCSIAARSLASICPSLFAAKTSARISRSVRTSSGVLWLPNCGSPDARRVLYLCTYSTIRNPPPRRRPPAKRQYRIWLIICAKTYWRPTVQPDRPARREPAVYLTPVHRKAMRKRLLPKK